MVAIMHVGSVSSPTMLLAAALTLLATNSRVAMRRARARGDVSSAIFVAASTLLFVALLATVHAHDLAGGRRRRDALKALAWALSTALTAMFAHRVVALVSAPSLAALIWSMAAATVAGGFCCLFVILGAR
ncbi:hypothetical protein QOZ80_1BG0072420 [Eleusine coracana subsp. coracana]|nr:hypothetical protein QOZ80_1BG0072420 [Eleusine coracana subsp. coracana]